MKALCSFTLVALLSVLPALGGTVPLSEAPAAVFDDCESVTNAPIEAAMLQKTRVFTGEVSLLATPSNMVEVAFGTARNVDGVLLPGDEAFAVGWQGGAWFFASATNRVVSTAVEGSGRRSLSFQLRLSEDGEPLRLSLSASGVDDAFPALVEAPPEWMFFREWDTARLTIRGVDNPAEDVSVRFSADPWVILFR